VEINGRELAGLPEHTGNVFQRDVLL